MSSLSYTDRDLAAHNWAVGVFRGEIWFCFLDNYNRSRTDFLRVARGNHLTGIA